MADGDEDLSTGIVTPAELREDVNADVRAAFAEHLEAAEIEQPTETAEQKAERARDAAGKFVKAEAQTTATANTPITEAGQNTEPPVQQSSAGGPPAFLSAEAKAEWAKAPGAVQAALIKRDADANEGARQWSEQRQTYEQAIGPANELANEYQMPLPDVVARLVSVERQLGNPETAAQTIVTLAQSYGVDLVALVNGSPQPQPRAPQFDPNIIPQIIEQTLTEREQSRDMQNAIRSFGSKPENVHFNTVKPFMAKLLQSGAVEGQTFEEMIANAYDQAVWATPSIRTQLQAAQTAPAINRGNIQKAKKAGGVSLNGSPGGQAPINRGQVNGSVVDDVRAAFAQHSAEA